MFVSCLGMRRDIAAATANSRRLSQQNPYKTCVSLVELGRTSRDFIVHFEKIPTKKFPTYGRCAVFEILGVSNAKAVRFWFFFYVQIPIAWHAKAVRLWFFFYVQIPIAWHVRAISPASGQFDRGQ